MALTRGAISGLVDLNRVAVLRTASNFDRPYPGESAWHSSAVAALRELGGFVPAISNLWAASAPFIKDVVATGQVEARRSEVAFCRPKLDSQRSISPNTRSIAQRDDT